MKESPIVGQTSAQRRKRRKVPVATEPEAGRQALTVPQSAFLLNCSPNTVWNLLATGQLKSFTLGRKRLIARSAIDEFIASGGTQRGADS